jgi:hypothetical protein
MSATDPQLGSRGPWALIVVDVRRGFIVPAIAQLVTRIAGHLRDHRDRYDVVLATRFVNQPGSLYETVGDWCRNHGITPSRGRPWLGSGCLGRLAIPCGVSTSYSACSR